MNEGASETKPIKKVDKANIWYLYNKQLKDKLENIEVKNEIKAKKKKNINDKVRINKYNN